MPTNIIFIKSGNSTFINKDEAFLKENYNTRTIQVKKFHGVALFLDQLRIACTLILNIKKYDVIYIWFADFYGFIPVIISRFFGKKSLVVLGGYDVYCLPEFNYGICMNPVRNFCAKYIYRNASHLLTLGEKMQKDVLEKIGADAHRSQILNIPTGYDPEKWFCDTPKKKRIIMVAFAETRRRISIKGIDRFVEIAEAMPQYEFLLVGLKNPELFFDQWPSNLTSTGYEEDLREMYSESKVYLQLSLTEGFPNVLCEAMLCQCIPVATNVGGTREIVGDTGFIIEKYSVAKAKEMILDAMKTSREIEGLAARKQIANNFTFEHRKDKINKILSESTKQG